MMHGRSETAVLRNTSVGLVLPGWLWITAVWLGTAAYAVVFAVETTADHNAFRTGVDLAFYDQLLWLLSHGHEPFSTVVSRPLLADHFQPGVLLFTPLYWLGLGVPGILTVQAIGLALTAPALFALARASGASRAVASIPAFLWLVCPWVATMNLFEFHPLAFSPVLIVLSVLAAFRERWIALFVTAALAVTLKEDVALTYVMLGLLLAYRGQRRVGAVLTLGSAAWLVMAYGVIRTLGGSYDAYGQRFAGDRGDSVPDTVGWMLSHPLRTLTDIADLSLAGVVLLLVSTGCLALLAPSWMLLAAPTALHNALSAYQPQHELVNHYHLGTLIGLFVAAAIGAGRVHVLSRYARLAVTGTLSVAAMLALVGGLWAHRFSDTVLLEREPTRLLLDRIPPDAPVAAARSLVPHLTHRVEVHTLPEPFIPLEWGSPLTDAEFAERAERIRFVAYVEGDQIGTILTGEDIELVPDVRPTLLREGFVVIAQSGKVEIFERRR